MLQFGSAKFRTVSVQTEIRYYLQQGGKCTLEYWGSFGSIHTWSFTEGHTV